MSTEKTYFTLCGTSQFIENWVQPLQELSGVTNLTKYSDLISTHPLPLRYWHQIPERWKNSDPGFYILLRDAPPTESILKPWILSPNQYYFFQPQVSSFSKVLILTHHSDIFQSWSELQEKFPKKDLVWSCYDVKGMPLWPKESYINMHDALFSEAKLADAFFDINYWQGDTLSPLHLHCLQTGINPLNLERFQPESRVLYSTFYGLFLAKKHLCDSILS